jgi:type III restriction enzyme
MSLHPAFPASPYVPLVAKGSAGSLCLARERKANGDLSNYTPDFIVRATNGKIWIAETKDREELDLPQKMARLSQWCVDATAAEESSQEYDFVFVDQIGFNKHAPKTFATLVASFTEYKT